MGEAATQTVPGAARPVRLCTIQMLLASSVKYTYMYVNLLEVKLLYVLVFLSLVGWLVGRLVYYNILKEREVSLPCSYKSTFKLIFDHLII